MSQTVIPWEGKKLNIKVVGDVILDEYLEGSVDRISPEAPVPVHKITATKHTAGGAANVARNIQLSGGESSLFGVWGSDEAAGFLKAVLDKDSIDYQGVLTDETRPTIRKTRVTANHQQLLRIDWEEVKSLNISLEKKIFESIEASKPDCLVISDYGKGCLSEPFIKRIIEYCHENNVISIVDPKGNDYSKYKNAFLVKPNYKEACLALRLDHSEDFDGEFLAREIQKNFGIKNVLVTLGAKGMSLVDESGSYSKVKANAKEVFDVSGAGDAVVAIMALGIASTGDLNASMELANVAGGIVVEKWGTQPVLLSELKEKLSGGHFHIEGNISEKIISKDQIEMKLKAHREQGRKIVFTNGCFDVMHPGHVDYLEKAKRKGDVLVIGVNSDDSVKRLKGEQRPINPSNVRKTMLAALSSTDYIVEFAEDTPKELIEEVRPNVLVKGGDYTLDTIVGRDFVEGNGGKVELIPFLEGFSTTSMIKTIIERSQ